MEKPILFSGPMVKALLAGKKTQTRRIVKAFGVERAEVIRPYSNATGRTDCWSLYRYDDAQSRNADVACRRHPIDTVRCPYGVPGDRLWVRETHAVMSAEYPNVSVAMAERMPEGKTLADTDGGLDLFQVEDVERFKWLEKKVDSERWRPSIFMPRELSRIALTIAEVRVQRLQAISEEDAIAEGVSNRDDYPLEKANGNCPRCCGTGLHGAFGANYGVIEVDCTDCETAVQRYAHLWNSINGKKHPWKSNPWVWAVSFRVEGK